jgi:ATP-binding cassette subfamily B protein
MSPEPSMMRRGLRLLWRSVRTHPGPFVVSLLGSTLFGIMSVGSTVVLGRVTDHLIIPAFRTGVRRDALIGSVLAIMAVALLRAAGVATRRYFAGVTSFRMMATWRRALVDTYLDAPLSFHEARPTGELMAHADLDAEAAAEAISPLPFALAAVLIAVIALVRLLSVDPLLALVGAALFPTLAVMTRIYTKRVEQPAAAAQARYGDVAAVAHESFDGALVVKTLGLELAETERLARQADRLRSERLRAGQLRAAFDPGIDALPSLGTIGLLALGAWRVSVGAVSPGHVVEAMALFAVLALPMRVLGYLLEELPRSVVSSERLDRVLATAPEVTAVPADARLLPDEPLRVDVRDVRFGFEPSVPVLDGLTMHVDPGQIVAVVGATASGKSTLCDLVDHLADPWSGTVSVGGVDLRCAEPATLRRAVAMVFQETFLFADTVRGNVTLGDEALSDEEISRALETAQAAHFVAALPNGLDTIVGERGITLSGGQRQRLALARALVRRPRLLLLDDATSAVDPRVEQRILDALRRSLATTTLIVAHRVSTIALADSVRYLRDGRVVATGAHAALLSANPGYEALVRAYEVENEQAPGNWDADDGIPEETRR